MNSQGEELVTTLKSMKELSNIIIDLRGNSGGYRDYGQKYLYSPLHSEDVTMRYTWFVPASDANKSINNSMFNRFLYGAGKEGVGFNYTREYTYTGDSEATDQSIYYLINGYTGSAADGYVGMIKEKKLGTIIGSSADGEGLADSFICHSLKNSGLVYIYFPSLCYNQDGSNNSLYGTSPDIYIEPTKEGFYQQRDLSEKGIDISIYTEKVKYDNVLIKVIEIIQEDNKFY